MGTIGQVKHIKTECEIEWKILYFSSLSEENSTGYYSPEFSLFNISLRVEMYPNGRNKISTGYVSLYLFKMSSGPPIKIKYSLGLKTLSGQKDSEENAEFTFEDADVGYGYSKFISRSQLFERKDDLLPSDVITLFCTLQLPTSVETPVEKLSAGICSLCEKTVDADNLLVHQKKDKAIKCAECSAFLTLQNWCDHECQCQAEERDCQPTTALPSDKLSSDFEAIMLSGDHSDTVIKVKTEEFRVHRSIMAARNSYFDAMFKSDMKEKSTGIITIHDCEPNIFRSFIHFVYSGKVDKISPENVCELYKVADKYQEDQLKNICLKYMLNAMSIDNFCNYFILAFTHDEKELLQKSIEFFTTNGKEIVRSVKWQTCLLEYPTQANELFIKHFDYMST